MANFQMFTFQLTGPAADTQQRYRRNACDRCATRKVKCDGKQPCSACHKTQAPCRYSYITRQPPKLKSPTTTAAPSPSTAPPLLNHTLQASVSTTLEPPTTSVDPRPDPIVSAAHSGPAGLMISTPVTYTAHSSQSQSASPIVPTAIAMPARPEDSPVLAQPSRSPLPRDMAQYLAALIQSLTLNPPYERNELISGERTGHGPATTAGLLHSSQTQPTPLPPLSSVIARSVSDPLPHGFIRPVLAPLVNHLAQTMSLPSPPTVLATEDDVIYHPTLIRCTLHAFVKHQIRIYRNLYFQRLMRKLNCNKIAPIVLHFLMAYGSSLFLQGQHGFTLEVCRYITQLHLDRFDYYLRMEHDQHHQEVPYIALAISGACTLSTNFNCYSKYSELGIRLMKQQGYHQVDLAIPSPMAAPVNSQTTLVPADDNYLREYKRRAFWETYILGAMYYSQIGKPYPFSAEDICVRPVNDHLIHHILTMDPDRDNYPVVLPGIRHMMCGYKPLIAFFHLASKVANLRGQAWQKSLNPATTYASGSAIPAHVLATYHDLNHHLQVWYAELPDSLALSDYANLDKDKVKKHPVHHSYLYTIHAGFHHTILLLNLHNWTLGTPDATPGLYVPERDRRCHEWALASAHAYTRQCFPLIQRLPPMVCNVCIAGHTFACALKYVLYLKHFWYYHTLTSDSASGQNAQGDNHDLDTGTRLEPGSAFTRTLASPSPLPTTMASFATPITHEAAYRERQWLRATANDYIKFLDHLRLYFLYARAFRDILQTHLDACPQ